MNKVPIIIGIKGYELTTDEKYFLKEKKPLGIILFSRNINSPKQVCNLTYAMRKIIGRKAMILVDQEGGKVSRLREDCWNTFPNALSFGRIAKKNLKKAEIMTFKNFKQIGIALKNIGINYNCAPVLDLKIAGASKVIGDRAFSRDPSIVSKLGYQACKGLLSEEYSQLLNIFLDMEEH